MSAFFLVIGMLFVNVLPSITKPAIGYGCYDSPYVLGTSNVPVTNQASTTVINIWAIIPNRTGRLAAGWIYKNAANKYWIQVDGKEEDLVRSVFGEELSATLLSRTGGHFNRPLMIEGLHTYDSQLSRSDALIAECFNGDLPRRYY